MSSDNQLNYGLDMDTIDIADSVIIDVATKTLATIPGIHSLSPRFYDELVEGITHAFGQRSYRVSMLNIVRVLLKSIFILKPCMDTILLNYPNNCS